MSDIGDLQGRGGGKASASRSAAGRPLIPRPPGRARALATPAREGGQELVPRQGGPAWQRIRSAPCPGAGPQIRPSTTGPGPGCLLAMPGPAWVLPGRVLPVGPPRSDGAQVRHAARLGSCCKRPHAPRPKGGPLCPTLRPLPPACWAARLGRSAPGCSPSGTGRALGAGCGPPQYPPGVLAVLAALPGGSASDMPAYAGARAWLGHLRSPRTGPGPWGGAAPAIR